MDPMPITKSTAAINRTIVLSPRTCSIAKLFQCGNEELSLRKSENRVIGVMRTAKGFTLVEVLIVIIIIAVLASVAVPKITHGRRAAHESSLKSKLHTVREAVGRAQSDTGLYPANLADLCRKNAPSRMLNHAGNSVSVPAGTWQGPYLDDRTAGIHDNGKDLFDPVCGGTFEYKKSGKRIGRVKACASGRALDGTDFEDW
jgi:prepilin-type N-terminal cleavage/methylation domain-containing protein